jgi:hypothetical protein
MRNGRRTMTKKLYLSLHSEGDIDVDEDEGMTELEILFMLAKKYDYYLVRRENTDYTNRVWKKEE